MIEEFDVVVLIWNGQILLVSLTLHLSGTYWYFGILFKSDMIFVILSVS